MVTTRKRWPAELKDALIQQQDGLCWHCGGQCDWRSFNGTYASLPTFEHKIPLSQGGDDELHNLAVTHRGCNDQRNYAAQGIPLREDPKGLRPKAGSLVPKGCAPTSSDAPTPNQDTPHE